MHGIDRHLPCRCAALIAFLLLPTPQSSAQAILQSSDPPNGATGVPVSSTVTFRFSDSMDADFTEAVFYSLSPIGAYVTTQTWNPARTILTCTPDPTFPANVQIMWAIQGVDELGLDVFAQGSFSTGAGGGGTGSGTNAVTSFAVGKDHSYLQESSATPVLDPNSPPFSFVAVTGLASNRTASSISLQLPGGSTSSLMQIPGHPEQWVLGSQTGNLTAFEGTYPAGDYVFTVLSTQSNQMVTVSFPAVAQPSTPRVSNYAAAQNVVASQPFTLSWDPFTGGTAADFIHVIVGNAWESPAPLSPGALTGTATSVSIPAGTLAPATTYDVTLSFQRGSWTSNATYVTSASRSTTTHFTLITASGAQAPPVISNPARSGSSFSFDVETSVGQQLTAVWSSDPALPLDQWTVLTTTNSTVTRVTFSDPAATSATARFYAVRTGL